MAGCGSGLSQWRSSYRRPYQLMAIVASQEASFSVAAILYSVRRKLFENTAAEPSIHYMASKAGIRNGWPLYLEAWRLCGLTEMKALGGSAASSVMAAWRAW